MVESNPFVIVMPVYPEVNNLDVTAPREMFGWWDSSDPARNLQILIAAEHAGTIST